MSQLGHSRRRRAMAGSRPCPETPKTGRSVDGWRHLFRCATCRGNSLKSMRTAYTTPQTPPRRQIWRVGALVGWPITLRLVVRHSHSAISINSRRNSSLCRTRAPRPRRSTARPTRGNLDLYPSEARRASSRGKPERPVRRPSNAGLAARITSQAFTFRRVARMSRAIAR
jgi:hypothetical protein